MKSDSSIKTVLFSLSLLICAGCSYQDDDFNKRQAMLAVACDNEQPSACIDYANNYQERRQAQGQAAAALNSSADQMNNQLRDSFKAEQQSTTNLYNSIP